MELCRHDFRANSAFNAAGGSTLTIPIPRAKSAPSGRGSFRMRTQMKIGLGLILGALWIAPAVAAPTCHNGQSFEAWLDAFKKDARAQGISAAAIAEASPSLTFDPAVI